MLVEQRPGRNPVSTDKDGAMLLIAFYIAIAAEAMTAALAAGRRNMDWFGVCLIACVTALGGGTLRDILLDHYPLVWVENPYLLLEVCAAALITIPLARLVDRLRWPFLLLDALGLVVFTVIGCNIGMEAGVHPIIVIVAGMQAGFNQALVTVTALVIGIAFRLLAIRFRWEMPKFVYDREMRK